MTGANPTSRGVTGENRTGGGLTGANPTDRGMTGANRTGGGVTEKNRENGVAAWR